MKKNNNAAQTTITQLKVRMKEADEKMKELYRVSVRSEISQRVGVILFVDDMEEQATVIKSLLAARKVDIQVVSVKNVESAQRHIERYGCDNVRVVIIDIQLEKSDGRTLIKWLEKKYPEIPFIISTGHKELVGQLEHEFCSTEIFIKGSTKVEEYAEALGLPQINSNMVIPNDKLLT